MIFKDERIFNLYIIAKGNDEPMINHNQREAVDFLGSYAREGNEEAVTALQMLNRYPDLHPLIREKVANKI
jgi:hypothetical protein